MDGEQLRKFAQRWNCCLETAAYYFDLRAEGCTVEAALAWCGLLIKEPA
ncbi:hypothetical protein ACTPOE_16850 [Castellaniella sp. WN]